MDALVLPNVELAVLIVAVPQVIQLLHHHIIVVALVVLVLA